MSPDSEWHRSSEMLTVGRSCLVVIDVQERLLPSIPQGNLIVHNIRFLLEAAAILGVHSILTEQYPKGLGRSVEELGSYRVSLPRLEKLRFSAGEVLNGAGVLPVQGEGATPQIILTGIETHICVQQTALDLHSRGYAVYIASDAVGSRHSADHAVAISRMLQAGVKITSSEAIAFEWCEKAGTEQFKALSRLVKDKDSLTKL